MSASTYATINPFTEQLVKTYTPHTPEEVERMLAAADGAYRSDWSRGPIEPPARGAGAPVGIADRPCR